MYVSVNLRSAQDCRRSATMEQLHKPHRKSKEKKDKKKHTGGKQYPSIEPVHDSRSASIGPLTGDADPNPKAFAFSKPGKLQKAAARSQDVCYSSPIDHFMCDAKTDETDD